jgi:hypothetical protein
MAAVYFNDASIMQLVRRRIDSLVRLFSLPII